MTELRYRFLTWLFSGKHFIGIEIPNPNID